jgi:hypothetical protein
MGTLVGMFVFVFLYTAGADERSVGLVADFLPAIQSSSIGAKIPLGTRVFVRPDMSFTVRVSYTQEDSTTEMQSDADWQGAVGLGLYYEFLRRGKTALAVGLKGEFDYTELIGRKMRRFAGLLLLNAEHRLGEKFGLYTELGIGISWQQRKQVLWEYPLELGDLFLFTRPPSIGVIFYL